MLADAASLKIEACVHTGSAFASTKRHTLWCCERRAYSTFPTPEQAMHRYVLSTQTHSHKLTLTLREDRSGCDQLDTMAVNELFRDIHL